MWESLAGIAIGAIIKALVDWLGGVKTAQSAKTEGSLETSNETQTVIGEIADERSKIPPASNDAAALADSLRKRAGA